MADFSPQVNAVGMDSSSAQMPVNESTAQSLSGLGGILSNLQQGLSAYGRNKALADKKADKEQKNLVVASYVQDLMKVSRARDQGVLSLNAAKSQMRAITYDYLGNHSQYQDDILKAAGEVTKTSGLAKNIDQQSEQEKIDSADRAKASADGWKVNTGNPEIDLPNLDAWRAVQHQNTLWQAQVNEYNAMKAPLEYEGAKKTLRQQDLTYQRGVIGKEADQIALLDAKMKHKSMVALSNIQDGYGHQYYTAMQDIKNKFDKGGFSSDPAENAKLAVLAAQQQLAGVRSTIASIGSNAGGGIVSTLAQPMIDYNKGLIDYFTGKSTSEKAQSDLNAAVAKKELLFFNNSDPDTQMYISASKLLGPSVGMNLTANVQTGVSKTIDKMKGLSVTDPSGRPVTDHGLHDGSVPGGMPPPLVAPPKSSDAKTNESVLGAVKSAMSLDLSGQLDKEGQAELVGNVSKMIKSIHVYKDAVDHPAEYNGIMDWLSSGAANEWAVKHKGVVTGENGQKAAQALTDGYERSAKLAIKKEWEYGVTNAMTSSTNKSSNIGSAPEFLPDAVKVKDEVEPVFDGGKLTFKIKPTSKYINNPYLVGRVITLNKKTAPLVTKLVRAQATLAGTNNYESVYNKNIAPIFETQDNTNE